MTTTPDDSPAPAPRTPVRALLRGNVLWLSVASLLNDTASEMIYPLLPIFLTGTLGAGAAALGAIEGIAESTSSLLKLAGGVVADRTGRRKALVAWGYALAGVARPLVAFAAVAWQVLAIRLLDRAGKGIRTAPRDALLTDSIPAAQRGTAFGIHRAADHAGAVVGPLLASALLLAFPGDLKTVFLFALVPALLTVLVIVARVRETAPARPDADVPRPTGDGGERVPRFSALGPVFPRYLGVLALFALGNASDAFLLLRAQQLGVAVALIPLLWGVLHLSKAVWSVVGGRLSDRTGPRGAIVLGWGVYAAVYLAFAVATEAWHAWALFAVYGLFFGLTEAPEKALVAWLAPEGTRGRAFGAYHFVVGLAALPASLLFGALWQAFGAATAFATGAALALAAALLLPFVIPPRRLEG